MLHGELALPMSFDDEELMEEGRVMVVEAVAARLMNSYTSTKKMRMGMMVKTPNSPRTTPLIHQKFTFSRPVSFRLPFPSSTDFRPHPIPPASS